jgi:DNA-binding response OmpR family regulator
MLKVLIVDDDNDLLEMVSLILQTHGMEVLSLNDHTDFFTALSNYKPDLVVLDIYLNDADGRELCRQLKKTEEFSGTPVLLYSAGHISPSSIEDCQANDFLQKSFNISVLLNRIHQQVPQPG